MIKIKNAARYRIDGVDNRKGLYYCRASLRALCLATMSSAVIGAAPLAAHAQSVDGLGSDVSDPAVDDEYGVILVTARGRAEDQQDTPIAVVALGSDDLAEMGVSKTADLGNVVPNMTINYGRAASNPQISIRGVGNNDYNDSAQATVGFYVDGVAIDAQPGKMAQMFDLANVQVLKGPQGTLFGRNNTSGAILISSIKPDGTVSGDIKVGVSSWGTVEGTGAIQFPLGENLSVRVAGRGKVSDGYGRRVDPQGAKIETLGAVEEYAGRAIAVYDDSNGFTTDLTLSFSEANNERPPVIMRPNPGETDALGFAPLNQDAVYENQNNYDELEKVRTRGAFLHLSYDTGGILFDSTTAYWLAHRWSQLDPDHTPNNLFHVDRDVRSRQYSQEFRASSTGDSSLEWVAGLYYLHAKLDNHALFGFFSDQVKPNLFQTYTSKSDTAAAFAELIWKIAPKLSLTGGARVTYDDKSFDLDVDPAFGGFQATRSRSWTKPTWRAILDYKPSDQAMVYASVSRGFQGGGFNGGAFSERELGNGFEPEFLTAYEVGTKLDLLDGSLRINAAGFYYDYKDPQVFAVDVGLASDVGAFVQNITNAKDAEVWGADVEITAIVTDRFQFNVGAGVLDTSYGELFLSDGAGNVVSGKGNPLVNAPKFSLNAGADYELPTDFGSMKFHLDYSYKSKQYLDITKREVTSSPAHALLNGRISADFDSGVRVSFFARNITDRQYHMYSGDISTGYGLIEEVYNQPRSFGAEFSYSW